MGTIFWKIIKDRRISTIIYCVAAVALVWMYIAMYPTITKQTAVMNEAFKNYPEALLKAFGIEQLTFDHLENFLAMEQFSIIWPVMVIFMVAAFASNSLAREVEKGTAEILLSRPISRLKIFFGRYLAAVAVLAVFTILSTMTVPPIAGAYNIDYQFTSYIYTAILGFLFGWTFLSIAFMCSALFSEKSRVAMSIGGLAVVIYVMRLVSSFIEKLDWLKYLSFFHYFNANDTMINGTLKPISIVVFVGVIIACTAVGAWHFQKRDIAV